jgi:hypothetical protein
MPKFKTYDVAEMLGLTPIACVSDHVIWTTLLTPQVRSLLGRVIDPGQPQVMETLKGLFPGDEVTNLNDHRLYGGKFEFVRFPYINRLIRTEYGALVIKRDSSKIKAIGWYGDVMKGNGEMIYKAALRDRRFDGRRRTNDTALLDFPFDDPMNKPLPLGSSSELSIYGFLPGSRLFDATGEQEYEAFIANPFTFLDRPDLFLRYFDRVWKSRRAPGQVAAPIPDVSRLIGPMFEKVTAAAGYDFLENAPSHYHVVMWALALGYRITYEKDLQAIQALTAGIKRIKQNGVSLTRPQESWVVVLQSLRPVELIPPHLYLGGPVWPQNNIDQQNLWVNKPLHAKAAEMLPKPLSA